MYTLWFYRFAPGMTESTLSKLRVRGPELLYPGADVENGTFFGRLWGHQLYTHGSVFERRGTAAVRRETADLDVALENLRILAPALRAMEVRNLVAKDDPELVELGDDGWHEQVSSHWVDAAKANDELRYHLDVIGFSCLKSGTFPPYMVLDVWRRSRGRPYKWFGMPAA